MPTQEVTGNDILDALELTVETVASDPTQNAYKVFQALVKEQEAAVSAV